MATLDTVSVFTVTRKRHRLLWRAIASIQAQDYDGSLTHTIIIDDCQRTAACLASYDNSSRVKMIIHYETRSPSEVSEVNSTRSDIYSRQARLLNKAIRMSDARWIAFLDDDNEFESDHIRSLVACANRYGYSAVHSFRSILNADGSPYLKPQFPWVQSEKEAKRIFELCCSRGVWVRDTNILRDRAGPRLWGPFRNSTIVQDKDPIYLVDTSVWLLERCLLQSHPIPEVFTERDRIENNAWDDKLLEVLLDNSIRIGTTGLPTLRYYLGGVSNASRIANAS